MRLAVMVDAARKILGGLGDLVLPGVCEACAEAEVAAGGLCHACNVRLLSLVALAYCPRCGSTLGPNIPTRDDGCASCPNPLPRFGRVFRLGPYADPLRSVIRELKYRARDTMRRRMGRMLAQAVLTDSVGERFDVVLAVPMHWRRRLWRGCDHARTLAVAVAGELSLPVGDELVRVRNTPPQTHLSRTRRADNVHGAFAVRWPGGVEGARVLLVDDVTTTGATASEVARALLNAAALGVTLAVVAKAESPRSYEHAFA